MSKNKTRPARQRWAGLESRLLVTPSFSASAKPTQLLTMSGYRIDAKCTVLPIWGQRYE